MRTSFQVRDFGTGACRLCGKEFEKHTSRHAFCTAKHRLEYYAAEERGTKVRKTSGRKLGYKVPWSDKPKPISEEELCPEFAELDRLIAAGRGNTPRRSSSG